jgi:hypothetical protein
MYWSPDGESFEPVRHFRLNAPFLLSPGVAERAPADPRAGV